jgi:hypothetical protein
MFDDDSTSLHSQSNVELNHLDLISTKVHLALISTKQLPPTQEVIYGPNFAPISSLPNVNIEKVEVSVGLPTININKVEASVWSQELLINVKRNKEHNHLQGQIESPEIIHVLRMLPLFWLIKSKG